MNQKSYPKRAYTLRYKSRQTLILIFHRIATNSLYNEDITNGHKKALYLQ